MGLNNIQIDPKQMSHIEAIVLSMTPEERHNPDIIKASSKERIARGCGLTVTDVNKLLKQFEEMKKMMNDDPNTPYMLMLGTGWGMSDELLARADYFLEPIKGPTDYNHLSVRAACAIMLDRIQA